MNTVTVQGGDKGVRVIVDGNNAAAVEVPAGSPAVIDYAGVVEVRALGSASDTDWLANQPVNAG